MPLSCPLLKLLTSKSENFSSHLTLWSYTINFPLKKKCIVVTKATKKSLNDRSVCTMQFKNFLLSSQRKRGEIIAKNYGCNFKVIKSNFGLLVKISHLRDLKIFAYTFLIHRKLFHGDSFK